MGDLWQFLSTNETLLFSLAILSVISFIASLICVPFVIARIPENYFSSRSHRTPMWKDTHPVLRLILIGLKNCFGVILVFAGLAMLILPGQGVLTILIGVLFLDFPGKYQLERRLVQQKTIQTAIVWIRNRTGKPPLRFD